jgi:hypothetical protein
VTEPSRATPYLEEEAREVLERLIRRRGEASRGDIDVVPLSDAMLDRAAS